MSIMNCRFCGKMLTHRFADLGLSPLSNEYVSNENIMKGQIFYPLYVSVCDECLLVQAIEFSKPENIFSDYKYFSSFSRSWLEHCKLFVDMIVPYLGLTKNSKVVEIACNDGYLLQYFKPYDISPIGVEPAENVAAEAKKKGIEVVVDFFGRDMAIKFAEKHGKADLIIANNVFAHVPDINGFVEGLKLLLSPHGVITLEFPHILKLIKYNQFDTIYHEHFSYFSIITVQKILESHDLNLIKIEELETHGGSVRVYATHAGAGVNEDGSISRLIATEKDAALDDVSTYIRFNDTVRKIKRVSLKKLSEMKDCGKSIAAFGAAAKGNTFLNYCGIGRDFIDYVVDSNPHKQVYYLPGTHIPIVNKSEIFRTKPDYIMILPWNLKEEIANELKETRSWGCKLITMIPEFELL